MRCISLSLFVVLLAVCFGCDPRRNMTPEEIVGAPSIFRFSHNKYPITSATLSGFINDPEWCDQYNEGKGKALTWLLEIHGAQIANDDLGPPQVSFDGLDIHVSDWLQINGFTQNWSEWMNPRTGDRYAMTYHSGYDSVASGDVAVVGRHENLFRVISSGGTDDTTPFSIDATFTFTGVTVHGSPDEDEAALKRRLDAELPNNDLVLSLFERDNAGDREMVIAKFSPRNSDRD